jgi:hypothetical protein
MKSLLLYNLYPKSNWKEVTELIIGNVPYHEAIIINISLDKFDRSIRRHWYICRYLKRYPKIEKITFSRNDSKLGEVPGFDKMRNEIDYDYYDIITYTHSKGVTKSKNSNIRDWVKMMKYFVIERHDLCLNAFENGYELYGTQLHEYKYDCVRKHTFKYCDFWYGGTFVSVNLRKLKTKFISTNCLQNYYGTEAFWGQLCEFEKAYSAHNSPFSLYKHPYPENKYVLK